MAETKQVIVRVKRQASPKDGARWEEFSLPWRPSMNVIICLRDIAEIVRVARVRETKHDIVIFLKILDAAL